MNVISNCCLRALAAAASSLALATAVVAVDFHARARVVVRRSAGLGAGESGGVDASAAVLSASSTGFRLMSCHLLRGKGSGGGTLCLLLPLQSTTAIRARCGRSTVLSQPKKFADGAIIDYLFWKTTRYNQQSSLRLACQIATSRRRLPPSPRAAPVAAQHAAQRTECPKGAGNFGLRRRRQLHRLKASKLKSGVRKYTCAPCLGGGAAGWVRGLGEKRERQNRSSVFIAFSGRASARRTHWPALWSSLVTFFEDATPSKLETGFQL